MCGRIALCLDPQAVAKSVGFKSAKTETKENEFTYSQNASPGFAVPAAFFNNEGDFQIKNMFWGLLSQPKSHEEKLNFFKAFNARIETVDSKPMFSKLLRENRCIVAVDGFFEWKTDEQKQKQPYFVHNKSGEPMIMAGLFKTINKPKSLFQEEDSPTEMYTFTILTKDSTKKLEWLHDRMPVILTAAAAKAWLEISADLKSLLAFVEKSDDEKIEAFPVDKKVNKVIYQKNDCTEKSEIKSAKRNNIESYFQPLAKKNKTENMLE